MSEEDRDRHRSRLRAHVAKLQSLEKVMGPADRAMLQAMIAMLMQDRIAMGLCLCVLEGFEHTIKVYQENRWCYTRLGWGNLYFENANDAALAKLSWG